jgi:hypothetical protein
MCAFLLVILRERAESLYVVFLFVVAVVVVFDFTVIVKRHLRSWIATGGQRRPRNDRPRQIGKRQLHN